MYYDISDVIDSKIGLIRLHESKESKIFLNSNSVKGLSEHRAIQTRLSDKILNVEAFEIMKITLENDLTLFKSRRIVKENLQTPKHVIEFIFK